MQKTENESAGADSPSKFSPQDMNNMLRKMEQLQLLQSQLLGYVNAMNRIAMLAETDAQGLMLTVNEMYLKHSGYDREDLIGTKLDGLKSGHQQEDVFHTMWETISSAKVWRGLVKYRAKNGEYFWLDLTIFPQINAEHKIVKYLCAGIPATHFLSEEGAPELHLLAEHAPPDEDPAADLRALQHKYNSLSQELEMLRSVVSRHFLQVRLSAEGKITSANDNFIEQIGITEGNLSGKPLAELLSSRQPSAERSAFSELIAGQKAFRGGLWLANHENQHFYLYAALSPTANSEGEHNGFQFIASDLTAMRDEQDALSARLEELERNHAAVKEENAKLAAQQEEHEQVEIKLFSQVSALNESALVAELDLEGKIIFANDKLLKLLKRARQNVLEMPFGSFVDRDAPAPAFSDIWMALESGRSWKGVFYLNVPDQASEPVWGAFAPVKNESGEVAKFVSIDFEIGDLIRENTEIREQFASLIEQNRNLETEALRRGKNADLAEFFSGTKDLFYIECDHQGSIVEFSPQFTELTGFSREEAIGKPIQQLVHSELTTNYFDELDFSVEEHRPFEGEVRFETKGETPLFVRSVFIPAPESAEFPSGSVKSLHLNVTYLEEEKSTLLARYDELERALSEEKYLRAADLAKIEAHEETLNIFREYAAITDAQLFNIELDAEGKIININDNVSFRAGFEEEEIVGQNLRNLLHERLPGEARNELFAALQQKSEWQGDLCLRAREGEFWLATRLFKLEKDAGADFMLSGYDVTTLTQAKEQSRIEAGNARQEAESRSLRVQTLETQLASAREENAAQLQEYEAAETAAKAEINEREARYKALEQEKNELAAQAKNANAALEKEQQKNRELIEINRRSADKSSTLEARLDEAGAEIDLLKRELENDSEHSEKARQLEEDVKTLRLNNQSLQDEIAQLTDAKEALAELQKKTSLEAERQQSLAKAASARASSLATEIEDVLREQKQSKNTEAEMARKEQLIDQLNRRVGSIEEEKQNQRKAFAALSKELQQARELIRRQESKIRAFPDITHAELVSLFNENIELRSELTRTNMEVDAYEMLRTKELPALRNRIKTLENSSESGQTDSSEAEASKMQAEIRRLQAEIKQLQTENEALREAARDTESRLKKPAPAPNTAGDDEAERLAAELSNQQLSNTILQQRIKQYELSSSQLQQKFEDETQKLKEAQAQLSQQLAEANTFIERQKKEIARLELSKSEDAALYKFQDSRTTPEPTDKKTSAENETADRKTPGSFLIVAEDLALASNASVLIEESGKQAEVVQTIQEALENYESQTYDAVLITYELPGMNAFDFLDIIRNDYDDPETRLVVVITENDPISGKDYIQQGFNAAFTLDRLVEEIAGLQ